MSPIFIQQFIDSVVSISVTSIKGRLRVLHKHCKDLGRMNEDSDFDDKWKEQVQYVQ